VYHFEGLQRRKVNYQSGIDDMLCDNEGLQNGEEGLQCDIEDTRCLNEDLQRRIEGLQWTIEDKKRAAPKGTALELSSFCKRQIS